MMNDSDILAEVRARLRMAVLDKRPISPAAAEAWLEFIDCLRYKRNVPEQPPAPGEEAHAEYLRHLRSKQRVEKPNYSDPAWKEKVAAELLNKAFGEKAAEDIFTNGTSFSDATVREAMQPKSLPTVTVCALCGSTAMDAPGIGHYCPNVNCENGDGPMNEIVRPTQTELDAWWDSRYTRGRCHD